jgi:hypothetical protein
MSDLARALIAIVLGGLFYFLIPGMIVVVLLYAVLRACRWTWERSRADSRNRQRAVAAGSVSLADTPPDAAASSETRPP